MVWGWVWGSALEFGCFSPTQRSLIELKFGDYVGFLCRFEKKMIQMGQKLAKFSGCSQKKLNYSGRS